jgi:hypothetical protein
MDGDSDLEKYRYLVSRLHVAVMAAHDRKLHDKARALDPNYTSIPHGCDCPLCSMSAPMFDVYLGRKQ